MNLKPSAFFIVDPSYTNEHAGSNTEANLKPRSSYLDRLDVLLVVEGHVGWVQAQKVPDLVGDVGAHSVVPAIAEPNLK